MSATKSNLSTVAKSVSNAVDSSKTLTMTKPIDGTVELSIDEQTVLGKEQGIEQVLKYLQARNNILKAQAESNKHAPKGLTVKVSVKGAISVYGLGRFPVTLFWGQWSKFFSDMGIAEMPPKFKALENDPAVIAANKAHEKGEVKDETKEEAK